MKMFVRVIVSIITAIAASIVGGWIFVRTIASLLVGGGPGGGLLPLLATLAVMLVLALAGFVGIFHWLGRRSPRVQTNS